MEMNWPIGQREAENQATGTIFVVRIVFNDFTPLNGFSEILHADPANNALINGMLRELDLPGLDFVTYFIENFHFVIALRPTPPKVVFTYASVGISA